MRYLVLSLLIFIGSLTVLAHGGKDHDDEAESAELGDVSAPENPTLFM